MAVKARQAADEESRAEVDVLTSRLDKTTQLTKKIEASLDRLRASGASVSNAINPVFGKTEQLQALNMNVDALLAAIDRVRQPSDIKDNEEDIIRSPPDANNLGPYLNSIQRVNKAISELKTTNMKANQQAMQELNRLVQVGNRELEHIFQRILQEDAAPVEPLNFITKSKPWPILSAEKTNRLSLITTSINASVRQTTPSTKIAPETPTSQIYIKIRGAYLQSSLTNLAAASVNTAKKTDSTTIYKQGSNGFPMYAQALEGAFIAEHENVCALFPRDEWSRVFSMTTGPSMDELANALKELNTHIRAHLTTDCFLAFEIVEIMFRLSSRVEKRTGELRERFTTALRPIKDTAKMSLTEILEDTRKTTDKAQFTEKDVSVLPITGETMQRLMHLVDYISPLSSIMVSLGKDGWKKTAASSESVPSLASFDPNADGKVLFAMYAADIIDTLITSLQSKGMQLLKNKQLQGVFLANNLAVIRRQLRDSDLGALLANRLNVMDVWRKKATSLYMDPWREVSKTLMDVQLTSGNKKSGTSARPTSGSGTGVDSAAIVKSLSSKEKDIIKEKFTTFNRMFDELLVKYKSMTMEREVREGLARDVQALVEPLYGRFWERYVEVDKGRGKYVKYDKASLVVACQSLGKSG